MATIAIIVARGGSKRIPRKNVRPFLGRPIIQYSIEAALKSCCFDEVMVSTDDEEIAEIARGAGAVVPFFRSERTSGDYASTADVVVEVLEAYRSNGRCFTHACCVYPTAPFVTAARLKLALELLLKGKGDAVVPVVRFGFPIQRAFRIRDGFAEFIWPEHALTRSQDLEVAFHDAGQFYWVNVERFLELKKLFMPETLPLEIPESEVQDIDNEVDWAIAEMKYSLLNR